MSEQENKEAQVGKDQNQENQNTAEKAAEQQEVEEQNEKTQTPSENPGSQPQEKPKKEQNREGESYEVPPTPQELQRYEEQSKEKQKLINEILRMYDDLERLQIRSEELQQQNQYFIDKIHQFEKVIYETDSNQPF